MSPEEYEKVPLNEQEGFDTVIAPGSKSFWTSNKLLGRVLAAAFAVSLLGNAIAVWKSLYPRIVAVGDFQSPHAGLRRNVPIPYHEDFEYTDPNQPMWGTAWDNVTEDRGVVAMTDEWVNQHGVMIAQRFAWDDSRGIYLLASHHNFHCLRNIRIALIEARDNLTQSRGFGHLMHCLDGIRQDIMCDADDNLRWTGPGAKLVAGNGQIRTCRNFTKLEEWAKQHSACYNYKGDDIDGFPIIEHYKHCPEGIHWPKLDAELARN